MWLNFFPRVWRILSDKQRETLGAEIVPFICSGAHVIQRDCHPSALNTFLEALARCKPPVPIKPSILKYLGKSHNLWHRSTLLLEQIAFENHPMGALPSSNKARREGGLFSQDASSSTQQVSKQVQAEALDALSEMYSLLKEEDLEQEERCCPT